MVLRTGVIFFALLPSRSPGCRLCSQSIMPVLQANFVFTTGVLVSNLPVDEGEIGN